MTYTTFINVAYWAVLAVIVLLVWTIVGFVVAVLFMRGRRRRRIHYAYLRRVEKRDGRALEDTCWYLLGPSEARHARMISDAKAAVRVVRDARDSARPHTLVADLQEAL